MNLVEYAPSGVETVRQQKCCVIWSDLAGNCEAGKVINLSGIAIAKLSELLDEFKCHPNNMNHLRQQYIHVMCDLADSYVIADILGQLHGTTGTYQKLTNDLSSKIALSNYGLS